MIKIIKKILLNIFFVLISFEALSQGKPNPPCGTPPCGKGPPPPVGLPIDGGLSFLIIAGTAYGIYESRKRKKQ